jgi:two-component system, NarL family, sensor histidine kinase BarA
MTLENNFDREILELLLKNLKNEFNEIKKFKENGDLEQLRKHLHRLHGALCYCPVPTLKKATANVERALMCGETQKVPLLFKKFEEEVTSLLKKNGQNN